MQNFFIKGRDNPVVINFSFNDGLSLSMFDRIVFQIGPEEYATDTNPDKVVVDGNSLIISVGDTTALEFGRYLPVITGYNATYNDGYVLTGKSNPVLSTPVDIRGIG